VPEERGEDDAGDHGPDDGRGSLLFARKVKRIAA
jgi:hypothetical protein